MLSFYSRFAECAERFPDGIAIEMQRNSGLESFSYSELRQMAETVGSWLAENGFRPGTRCAILAANGPRWVAAYLGIIAAGCTAVPLDTAFRPDQIAKLLADSESSLIFADNHHLSAAKVAADQASVQLFLLERPREAATVSVGSSLGAAVGMFADLDSILARPPAGFQPIPVTADSTAAILYTSGTTSDPKGVMLTHDNLLGEIEAVFARLQVGPSDAILGVLPLFHALAQMANLLLPLVRGARIVYLETLNTSELMRALRERDITLFCCVPQFFYLIHERVMKEVSRRGPLARAAFRAMMQLSRASRALGWNAGKVLFKPIHRTLGSKMRYLITGGSRFDSQIGRDFHALGFDILQAYGLTETTGGAACTPPGKNIIGSVGPPLPGVEMKILDSRSPAEESGPPVGEIAIRGRIVMQGYYNRPDATSAVLQEGWLHTGDLGYFDSHGNLFITGRQKEVIVLSSGKNIYPEEIEQHYSKSASIKEICVMGLRNRPGEPVAERLHAVVVPNFEGLRARKVVNAKEVIRFDIETLSAQLPSTKRILSYDIWQQDLPRTTTRKLKRFEIEQRVRDTQSGAETAHDQPEEQPLTEEEQLWLEQPQVQSAIKVIQEASRSGGGRITPRNNLELDLGLDSMQRVELLMALQEALGAEVPESVVSEVYTVRELVDAALARSSSSGSSTVARSRIDWQSVLQVESPDPDVIAASQRRPLFTAAAFLFTRLLQLFFRDFFRLRVTGVEKLPQQGPFILCPNHQSYFDPAAVLSVLPWRILLDLFSLGTTDIFGSGIARRIARLLKIIPVDPDSSLVSALRAGAYGLRRGRILLLFPEGERSIDGTPRAFKRGAAILAANLQVPLYPVALDGFFDVWPRGKPVQGFFPVRMAFGDPIFPPAMGNDPEATYESIIAELRARVVKMWNELQREKPQAAPPNS